MCGNLHSGPPDLNDIVSVGGAWGPRIRDGVRLTGARRKVLIDLDRSGFVVQRAKVIIPVSV